MPAERLLRRIFPVLLCLSACFLLGGELGKWNDDYFFLGQFDRKTGEVRSYVMDRPLPRWRPLYDYIATPVITALLPHDRARHALAAAVHGAVCLGLFGVLRRAGASRRAAAAAAMAFMVYPVHFECVFWTCSFPTALACGLMLGCAALQLRWAGRVVSGAPTDRWTLPGAAALTLAAAGFNDQPAAIAAALPGLTLAALLLRSGSLPRRRALLRALAPSIAAVAAMGAHGAVQVAMFVGPRAIARGESGAPVPERLRTLVSEVAHRLPATEFAPGACRYGLEALTAAPLRTVFAAAVVVAALGWVVWFARAAPEGESAAHRRRGLSMLLAAGLAWFAVAWAPAALIIESPGPRLFYAPGLGMAVALAALVDLLAPATGRAAAARRAAVAAVLVPALLAGGLAMVGIQLAYQRRWRADRAQGQRLRELVPRPESGAVFVPVTVGDWPLATGSRLFDRYFMPPLTSSWAAGWYVQDLYRRNDLRVVQSPYGSSPLVHHGEGLAGLGAPLAPPARKGRVAEEEWGRLIPFEVTPAGEVRLFTRVVATGADGHTEEFVPRQIERARRRGPAAGAPDNPLRIPTRGGPAAER